MDATDQLVLLVIRDSLVMLDELESQDFQEPQVTVVVLDKWVSPEHPVHKDPLANVVFQARPGQEVPPVPKAQLDQLDLAENPEMSADLDELDHQDQRATLEREEVLDSVEPKASQEHRD